MELLIHRLFDQTSVEKIYLELEKEVSFWQDGRKTAGSHAAHVKNNFQLDRNSKIAQKLSDQIKEQLQSDQLIRSFSLPKKLHGLTFAKSEPGQGYGMHVDNAFMSSGRSDLSFTLFLSKPSDYEGGELSIQTLQENKEIKLAAGEIVVYPSTSLHAVKEVKQGKRIVCVGWIHSYVSSNEDRNLLFGLDAGARGLLAKYGQTDQLDLVFQAYNNLLRRLGD